MIKYFIVLLVFCGVNADKLFAQNLPSIQLDRPDQTECPFITPKKYIQIENGFTYEKVNDTQIFLSYPSTLWKYGINEKFELRIITELVTEKNNYQINAGITPITIGFKTALLEEKGIIPKTSFIGHITTSNMGSKAFQTAYIAPSFRFTMQHTLTNKISVAYNLGAEWDGATAAPTYIYTFTTGLTLTEKLGCYSEIYGFLQNAIQADHRFDCGVTYLLSNDCIADISGGFGLTNNAPNKYISLGFSYRFKTTKK
ncbi:MAG TPA: transporter [Chitinophagaceae bacterium]|nr:transporter [Chitinophagaceae bacterium]